MAAVWLLGKTGASWGYIRAVCCFVFLPYFKGLMFQQYARLFHAFMFRGFFINHFILSEIPKESIQKKNTKFWTNVQIRSILRTLYHNMAKKKFGQALFCLPYPPTQKVWTFWNQSLLYFKFSSFRQKLLKHSFLKPSQT